MWFLQRRSMHKQLVIIFNLGLLIGIVHIVLLVCLFFVYQDSAQHFDLKILSSLTHRDIEFRVAVEKIAPAKSVATMQKSSGKMVSTPAAKKMPSKSTLIVPQPLKVNKGVPAKAAKAISSKKAATKKAETKKSESAPTVQKKVEDNKGVPAAQPAQLPQVGQSLDKLKVNENADHVNLNLSPTGSLAMFEQEYQALYENLSDCWAPPSGVPATSQCVITVILDRLGEIDDMLVDSSSGMMVFDLAARSALSEIEFPRFVWGKSITVTFSV